MEDESLRKAEKPQLELSDAAALAAELYGLTVELSSLKELDSYDDRNFYFRATPPPPPSAAAAAEESLDANAVAAAEGAAPPDGAVARHYVLKVHNGVESQAPALLEAQNEAMALVRAAGLWAPRALPSSRGRLIETATRPLASATPRDHAVRCLPFRPAKLLGDVPPSLPLLRALGAAAARVAAALRAYDHPAARRAFLWDLAHAADVAALLHHLPEERRPAVQQVLDEFGAVVLPLAPRLEQAVIHGDLNDQNVLVDEEGAQVLGVIDFGDMVRTWRVNEIAITAAYVLIMLQYDRRADAPEPPDAASALATLIRSYNEHMPLTEDEWAVLPTLISCRLATSLSVGAYSSSKDPDNEYLKLTLVPGWKALQGMRSVPSPKWTELLQSTPPTS